jgi:hypothetical protein
MGSGIRDQTGLVLWENGDGEALIHAFRGRPAFPEEVTENPTFKAQHKIRSGLTERRAPAVWPHCNGEFRRNSTKAGSCRAS